MQRRRDIRRQMQTLLTDHAQTTHRLLRMPNSTDRRDRDGTVETLNNIMAQIESLRTELSLLV